MTRKRLTREESRDQTRQRLLDAALALIAQKGLAATSVEDIAEAAGYSRGAVYSNFGGKGDLFIELLRRDHQQATAEFDAVFDDALPIAEIRERMRELYVSLYADTACFMNWTEARMLAARDADFRDKFAALISEKCGQVAGYVGYFYQRLGVEPPASPEVIAMGFMSLMEGVKLFMLSSPLEMRAQHAEAALAVFMDSITELATLKSTP
ncbi:TetR/AcrR family transcriptional regulator [Amantichitinum ursilacus]|uniref:HTH-type transcriptional regulator AcrR n=1 Tax=Amantichitinum ursilacus TaxID=857265 RepID=A0A0N0XN74_9NEIS|nr:TetR/AcrR family transcriptional regulator [Amantichitinum ursilacus]KPC55423.1 HTH-type transcriptional regulator AcrR [Amantichitinum ursilacus]